MHTDLVRGTGSGTQAGQSPALGFPFSQTLQTNTYGTRPEDALCSHAQRAACSTPYFFISTWKFQESKAGSR